MRAAPRPSGEDPPERPVVRWLGHATVLMELGGVRLLTDPVLRSRILHIRRVAPPVDPAHHAELDAVLVSHLHRDHLDVPSLRRLERETTRLVVPAGTGRLAARQGFESVAELSPGQQLRIGDAVVQAVPAVHDGGRNPLGMKVQPLGYLVEGAGVRVYFAGDTDLFDAMADLGELDLALLPVWGWGPSLGGGHLDPAGAARALTLLRTRVAVPIHWGTLFPGLRNDRRARLTDPPHEFAREAARVAPGVEVRVLAPGEATGV
jgi:L-ascorbate metabolism protein UlaG (beta-lactamase superfamily)